MKPHQQKFVFQANGRIGQRIGLRSSHAKGQRLKRDAGGMWQIGLLLVLGVGILNVGCQKSDQPKSEAVKPAKVEKLPVETSLATITLTDDAKRRLGITTVPVDERQVTQRRTLGGQAVVPSGKSIIVSSPLAGMVIRTGQQSLPTPGTAVASGTPLLSIQPLLSAERDVMTPAEQVQLVGARANLMAAETVAAGDVDRGKAEVEGARIAFDRATKLFANRAGAKRAVDDAEAQLNITRSNLAAAEEREKQLKVLLQMLELPAAEGQAISLPMTTPIGGLVNRIDVSEGQTVASGAVLFEVINLDTIWIRVPVFVDLLRDVQTDQPARLVSLSGGPRIRRSNFASGSDPSQSAANAKETKGTVVQPVSAPPTADAMSSSADLYYEVDNRDLGLRPGQRIGVELAMSQTQISLVVPDGAILYDVYGGTWVYVETGDKQYTRQRVSIVFVDDGDAVLSAGPKIGTPVVVDGAAELFGTEFGAGK